PAPSCTGFAAHLPLHSFPPRRSSDLSLRAVASEGIARVAAALPEQPGDPVVHRVRSEVWGAPVADGVPAGAAFAAEAMGFLGDRSEEHTSELQSRENLVCRLLLEKKN